MQELIEVSKSDDLLPQLKFPELLFASKQYLLHSFFYLYLAIFILNMLLGEFVTFPIFHVAMFILFCIAISYFFKSVRYQIFKKSYSIKLYYQRMTYRIGTIPIGKSNEEVHEYIIDWVTLPPKVNSVYSLKEKIKSIPKQKVGIFFTTTDIPSAYQMIIDDNFAFFENKFIRRGLFSSPNITESLFNHKILNMRNIDTLLIDYLPNGDIIEMAYQESETQNIVPLSKNLADRTDNNSLYSPLFIALSVFTLPFFIYHQYINFYETNLVNEVWYRLTTIVLIALFSYMIYFKMKG